jgi:hypothetical protein
MDIGELYLSRFVIWSEDNRMTPEDPFSRFGVVNDFYKLVSRATPTASISPHRGDPALAPYLVGFLDKAGSDGW